VRQIPLENSFFEGRNNAYLFEGEGPTTLVDTGVALDDAREQLASALADRGLAFADVDQVLVTHWHADHAGLAGEIQAESDATVRAHPADAPLIEQADSAEEGMDERHRELIAQWGVPPEPREKLRAFLDRSSGLAGTPASVDPFEPGEEIPAGEERLEVLSLAGHTAGLCGFVRTGEDEVLTGDALLPKYTPNVGGADLRVEHALATYLDTLARIVERDFDRAWPGHRDPMDDPAGRARAIIDHHRDRTDRVLDALADLEPADAWTVSARLFGDLENIHILHGPGEAFAHLDHLASHGLVERTADGYVRTGDELDLAELFPARPE
jgi:hydroxyacylglutathione hydrolase